MPGPLVSCLCVTKNKLYQLQRAVNCFYAQSYAHTELIIVYEGNKTEASDWIGHLKDPKIKVVQVSLFPKLSLGELRNISIAHAKGEYFCQWDDDDWYHRDRVKIQLEQARAQRQPVTFLMNWLIYNEKNSRAYFSQLRPWEGSILCRRDVYPRIKYPDQSRAEDVHFQRQLMIKHRVFPVVSSPLYIYVFHGKNTWDKDHFNMLFKTSQKLSNAASLLIGDILGGQYSMKDASGLLHSDSLLDEINYFHSNKQNLKNLARLDRPGGATGKSEAVTR
jgi:glycosyltransferase involved in cell wall biosynthesis